MNVALLNIDFDKASPQQHLLSPSAYENLSMYVIRLKKEITEWEVEHRVCGKMMNDQWLRRLLPSIPLEHWKRRYHFLASMIEDSLKEVDVYERILYNHRCAVEHLQNDMTYLRKVNIQTTELKQQNLF